MVVARTTVAAEASETVAEAEQAKAERKARTVSPGGCGNRRCRRWLL